MELSEDQNAKPNTEPNAWAHDSGWPSSMPSTAFFQTTGTPHNERSSTSSIAQNDTPVLAVHIPDLSPHAAQNWMIQPNQGGVGTVSNSPHSAQQQHQSQSSQQTAMPISQAPVLQSLSVVEGSHSHKSNSLPLIASEERREPSTSLPQPLPQSYNAAGAGRTSRSSGYADSQYIRSNGTLGNVRERARRPCGARRYSRAEEMVLDVERLYDFAIDVGIIEEDEAMLSSLRSMRSRFRAITRRVVSDDEDDLIAQELQIDSD